MAVRSVGDFVRSMEDATTTGVDEIRKSTQMNININEGQNEGLWI